MGVPGLLEVTVEYAKGLKDNGWFGRQDPYAAISLGGQQFRTKAHKGGGTAPVWNETFQANVDTEGALAVTVMDSNLGRKDEPLGHASISLATVQARGWDRVQQPVLLASNKEKGYVSLALKFTQAGGSVAKPQVLLQQPAVRPTSLPGYGVFAQPQPANTRDAQAMAIGFPAPVPAYPPQPLSTDGAASPPPLPPDSGPELLQLRRSAPVRNGAACYPDLADLRIADGVAAELPTLIGEGAGATAQVPQEARPEAVAAAPEAVAAAPEAVAAAPEAVAAAPDAVTAAHDDDVTTAAVAACAAAAEPTASGAVAAGGDTDGAVADSRAPDVVDDGTGAVRKSGPAASPAPAAPAPDAIHHPAVPDAVPAPAGEDAHPRGVAPAARGVSEGSNNLAGQAIPCLPAAACVPNAPGYLGPGYPQPHGYPPTTTSGHAPAQGYPPMSAYPPQATVYQGVGYMATGYPPPAYPPAEAYPAPGYPPSGYPPAGYPPLGYPPPGPGYPPATNPPPGYPIHAPSQPVGYPYGAYPPAGHQPTGYPQAYHPSTGAGSVDADRLMRQALPRFGTGKASPKRKR